MATPRDALGSVWQLQQEMDRLFDNVWRAFGWPAPQGTPGAMRSTFPSPHGMFENPALGDFRAKLDVSGNDNEYEVSIEVPGLSQDDIDIELQGDVLSIKGKKVAVNESKDTRYYRVERSVGSFQRTLTLPDDADADRIEARISKGVLAVHIPRKAGLRHDVKRIAISS
jgi:HSP20 family protein